MRFPQSLEGLTCEDLASRWQLDPELAVRLLELSRMWSSRFPNMGSLRIISGYRTAEEQAGLEQQGRPAAPDHLSTHRSCPATGADIEMPFHPDGYAKLELGRLGMTAGLRWGGGSPTSSRADDWGTPTDWNHFDLGPRRNA